MNMSLSESCPHSATMSVSDFMGFVKLFSAGTTTTNTNDSRRQALTRLKFIGRLKAHEKIDSQTLRVENNTILTSLKRFFITGDSRLTAITFFSSTIDRSFEILAGSIHSNNPSERIFCSHIIKDLIAAVTGLQHAQETYESDNYTVCELDVIIQSIEAKIYEIQRSHPDLLTMRELCPVQTDEVKLEITHSQPEPRAGPPINPDADEAARLHPNPIRTPAGVTSITVAPGPRQTLSPVRETDDDEYDSDEDRAAGEHIHPPAPKVPVGKAQR